MAILLYHATTTHGMIATNRDKIDGTPYPARRYQHDGHIVVLDGPAHVIAHDAEDICRIPGYRLATSQESNAYYAAIRGESALHETGASTEDDEDQDEENAPDGDDAPEILHAPTQTLTTAHAPAHPRSARRKG